jgi:tetratricopeptide (TPR) repeat protein
MPTTVNGIGTHYVGRRNVSKRTGPCPHCGRTVELTSYDTGLWFVIVFIPIFPLGRKRIIDQCPACRLHYAVDKQKWETARQLEISGAQEEFRKNPTPEAAIAVHQQLLKFHQRVEAQQFRQEMLQRFPHNAHIEAHLGAALEVLGQRAEAMQHYKNALSLRPDLPEARIGVARAHQHEGQLDEARKLLDFLEKPGASQLYSLQPLETLARAYQNVGQHNAALELFGKLQSELPKIAEVPAFRKMVKQSEKALGRAESTLPKQKFSWRRFFSVQGGGTRAAVPALRALLFLGIGLGVLVLGFAIWNEYTRRHRTLCIVSEFASPTTVQIGASDPVRVSRTTGMLQIKLPEGHYHASIKGPIPQELDFDVHSSYFDRWVDKPLWMINVGGAMPILFESVTYAQDPPPAVVSVRYGQTFEYFPNITHPFEDLPKTVQMKSGESRILTHLEIFHGDGDKIFEFIKRKGNIGDPLKFAESYLLAHPDETKLVDHYVTEARRRRETGRLDRYLAVSLTNRPVSIEWHRAYQRLHDNTRDLTRLLSTYDGFLKDDPTNSALLYLRGRIDPDRRSARQFFQKAAEADSQNAYAQFALGYDRLLTADWAQARKRLGRAVELAPDETSFRHLLCVSRLGAGEAESVQREAEDRLKKKQADAEAELELIYSMVIQGRGADAVKQASEFQKRIIAKFGITTKPATDHLVWLAMYGAADFAALEKATTSDNSLEGQRMLNQALLEQSRLDPKISLETEETDESKYAMLLALSVAAQNGGDKTTAVAWRRKAAEAMSAADSGTARAARLLSGATAPSPNDIDDCMMSPPAKAVFLVALAQLYPQSSAELLATARKFNIEPRFPYHLVRRATGDALRAEAAEPRPN